MLWQSWLVLGDIAPFLLLGFAIAGLLSVWITPEWTERHMGGHGMRPVLEAALWGIPVPLCSCSVIPVIASMRRHGASRAATTAFLLSSPQTGVDSIAVTYALLGPVFAIFRPIAALISGLLGGVLVLLFGRHNGNGAGAEPELPPCKEDCCTGDRSRGILRRALRYGFLSLPGDLAGAFLFGVLVAGALAVWMPANVCHAYLGGGIFSILLAIAAGVPLYVCATASVPIAAGLIYLGASPGTALAFLITGPATNPAAFATIWKVLGRRTALVYLVTVAASAILCGLLLDAVFLLPMAQAWLPHASAHVSTHLAVQGGWATSVWAAVLLAVFAASWLTAWRAGRTATLEHAQPQHEPACGCGHACSSTSHCH